MVYEYSTKVRTRIVFNMSLANKRNRAVTGRSVNRYTKWIEDGKVESQRQAHSGHVGEEELVYLVEQDGVD